MSAVPEDSRADLLASGESVAFGNYWLTRLIARGGMGEVYLARLVGEFGFEKRLVIKTILPHLAAKPRFVELFAAEAKTTVALSHGNIVPIYELGRTGDTFYIVMGHVDGPSVAAILEAYRRTQRVADIAVALHIVRGVLTGLAYAHTPEPGRPAVVHRDITPRNVLVDRSGQVRIVDFGIAAPADAEVEVRAGSTGYAAPEQTRSGTVDPRADVFSAAALLYELVTLERAFPRDGVWIEPDLDGLPECLRGPLAAALALDPERRPRDAGALLAELAPAFARYAATYGDAQLSAHVRELFPDGWDEDSKPAVEGGLTPRARSSSSKRSRPDTHTFATRLTLVTKVPSAASTPAPGPAPTSTSISVRWPWVAALAIGAGLAWSLGFAPPPEHAPPTEHAPPPEHPPVVDGARTEARHEPASAGPLATPATAEPPADPMSELAESSVHATDPVNATSPEPASEPPAAVRVAVVLEPADAIVLVDGKKVADPGAFELPPDSATSVVVRKDGYASRSFTVDRAHALPERIVLEPLGTGYLSVYASGVTWAEVTIDGKLVVHTPTRKLELPEGKHRVVVKCVPPVCDSERTMLSKTISLKAGGLAELRAE